MEAARLKEEAQAASRAETERLKRVEEEEEEAKAVEARRVASETDAAAQRAVQAALTHSLDAAEGMTTTTAVGTNVFNLSGWDPAGPGQASTSPDVDHELEQSEDDSQDSFRRYVSAPQCVVVGWYQVVTNLKWLVGPCCLPVTLFSP